MIDDYMKLLALGSVYPLVPPIVGKRLLFEMLKMSEIKLNHDELESLENHFKEMINSPKRTILVSHVINSINLLKKVHQERPQDFNAEIMDLLRVLHNMENK